MNWGYQAAILKGKGNPRDLQSPMMFALIFNPLTVFITRETQSRAAKQF
jgi:hypothetical protein